MKKIRIFFLLMTLVFTASCGSMALTSKVQKVSVGMTKQEVMKNLGDQYEVVHSVLTPDGDIVEILLFTDWPYGNRYEFEFYNSMLVRYTKLKNAEPDKKPEEDRPHKH